MLYQRIPAQKHKLKSHVEDLLVRAKVLIDFHGLFFQGIHAAKMRIVAVFGILFSSIVLIRCSFLTLRRDKCTKLPPMCYQLINSEYTRMYLPNILNQSRYEDVVKELKVWKPLLNTTVCNARHQLKYFLCFTYAPVCVADHFIYTCQSFCRRMRDSCDPIMRSLNYSWPPFFDCNDKKKFRNNSTTMCISDAMLGLKRKFITFWTLSCFDVIYLVYPSICRNAFT